MKKEKNKPETVVIKEDLKSKVENYEQILCPYCSSSRADSYRKSMDIVKCGNCDTVYLRTRLKKEAMELLYQSYNTDAPQMFLPKDQNEIKNSLLRRDYWIKEIMYYTDKRGNILDIGCGWGAFLDNARLYGFAPRGIEITKKGADFAKTKLNINATSDQFLDTDLEKNSFTVITLNHVLEHLPEPQKAVGKVYELLEPDGLFCGIVPNIESLCSFFMGESWEWLDPFYHYVHYSPSTVKKHLEGVGFKIEKIYTASGDYNRTELSNVIKQYYRPADNAFIPEIIRKIEANMQGEEIRFIARKPNLGFRRVSNENEYELLNSIQRNYQAYTASIIIPVYNKVEFTQKCLNTLYSINNGLNDFEVIVVNNDSSDETKKYLDFSLNEYHDLKVIHNSSNLRFAGACNIGAKHAEGHFLIFLNNDTVPQENWLSFGVNKLLADPSIGIVGSKLLYPDRTIQHCGVEYLTNVHNEFALWPVHRFLGLKEDDPLVERPGYVESVTGACLFISRNLFVSIEGFDENYVMYFEDLDLCFKTLKAGKKIFYEPKSVVIHYEGKSTPDEALRYKLSGSAAKLFYTKWKKEINAFYELKKHSAISNTHKYSLEFTQMFEINKKTLLNLIDTSRYDEASELINELKKYIPQDPFILSCENKLILLNDKSLLNEMKESFEPMNANSNAPKVSIITLTYNALGYTKEFVESVQKNTSFDYEMIIIDNNSTDETPAYLTDLQKNNNNIKVLLNKENIGFPAGINQGILESKGEYVLIANNDIVVTEKWLERLIEVAESEKRIGLVGPVSNIVSGLQLDPDAKYNSIEEMYSYAASLKMQKRGEILNFPRIAFLCTLVKREVIDAIGGLDEIFTPGNYEDDDYCLRAQLAGFKTIIAKDVFVHHYGSKSFKADGEEKYAKRLKINMEKFVEKWGVTPDELWLQNKTIKPHQINYPINKNSFIKYFERARVHVADNELKYATDSIEKAVENFNDDDSSMISFEDVLDLAGNICLAANEIEKAKSYFEKELEYNPKSSSACVGLGEIFMINEQYDSAKTMFEWAIKNNPQNNIAISSLSKVNEVLGYELTHSSLV